MKHLRKLISFCIVVVMLLNSYYVLTFAETTDDSSEEPLYSSLEEFADANTAELEEQGIEIIGGETFVIDQTDPKTRERYIVWVDWDVGYSPSSSIGLTSYCRAYSTNLNCLLKRLSAMFYWDDLSSAASGAADVSVTNIVPTYQLYSAYESRRTFSSGKKIRCNCYGDVYAISEISGGVFDYTDIVTIP